MSPTLDECRKHLAPVLAAARAPRHLSDDQCRRFIRQAKEMRHQLVSLVADADRCPPRSRFDSNASGIRRDGDITLVDAPSQRLPPKAPRAMLHPPPFSNKSADARVQIASSERPTSTSTPTSSSDLDLVHKVFEMFPSLVQHAPDEPTPAPATSHETSPPADFISHMPTHPGTWFKQRGRRYAEIVDVEIQVSDDMFYVSTERIPFRLRMHLRLCSLPLGAVASDDDKTGDAHAHCAWPKKGSLVVQVNPESERSKTWLPYSLESDPLDVTACMRPGKNTFRFIQLSDLSQFSFVLVASAPPPQDAWRDWDWASLVERPTATSDELPSTGVDSSDDLSEFAHIPVTIDHSVVTIYAPGLGL